MLLEGILQDKEIETASMRRHIMILEFALYIG